MSTLAVALLVAKGLLFAGWAFLMFRALFGILGRYRSQTGRAWIGPTAVFGVYYRYLKDPEFSREKWSIVVILALFVLMTWLFYYVQTT